MNPLDGATAAVGLLVAEDFDDTASILRLICREIRLVSPDSVLDYEAISLDQEMRLIFHPDVLVRGEPLAPVTVTSERALERVLNQPFEIEGHKLFYFRDAGVVLTRLYLPSSSNMAVFFTNPFTELTALREKLVVQGRISGEFVLVRA